MRALSKKILLGMPLKAPKSNKNKAEIRRIKCANSPSFSIKIISSNIFRASHERQQEKKKCLQNPTLTPSKTWNKT